MTKVICWSYFVLRVMRVTHTPKPIHKPLPSQNRQKPPKKKPPKTPQSVLYAYLKLRREVLLRAILRFFGFSICAASCWATSACARMCGDGCVRTRARKCAHTRGNNVFEGGQERERERENIHTHLHAHTHTQEHTTHNTPA